MNQIDLLVLQGPPGVGKSTIAKAIAGELRAANLAHAVIELDDLAKIYPREHLHIMYENLAAMWPNYQKLGKIKVILPTYLQKGEFEIVRDAAPARNLTLCEVVAPREDVLSRIQKRDADRTVQERLTKFVDGYANNRAEDAHITLKVHNQDRKPEQTAREIVTFLRWLA